MPRAKKATVETREISELKLAGFNPESRTNDIGQLVKSIETFGLLYPILIGQRNEVIDGHRRLTACKKLGWTEIPVLLAVGDQAELFSQVNYTNRSMSGNQSLCVYLKNPLAVGPKSRARMEECEEIVGRPRLERLAKEGLSMSTWNTARKIAFQADADNPKAIVKIFSWVMHHRNGALVNRALNQGTSPGMIMAAVEKNKPIRIRFDAGVGT